MRSHQMTRREAADPDPSGTPRIPALEGADAVDDSLHFAIASICLRRINRAPLAWTT